MGTRRSISKSDYRLYARPVSGESGDWVEVVADGGEPPQASSPTTHAEAEFGDAGGDDTAAEWPFDSAAAPGSRFNPYLCAAWAVVAIMLVLGLFWLFGNLEAMTAMYSTTGTMSRQEVVMMKFHLMGVYLLPFGLAGGLALLTVQAAGYRR
ncbi:hypothetical protein [Arthrobacter zhaoxinii]|uniref:hypothetical protein n=1 Tax=Arthrobacter zhaoxinii TaxID=2964616 RepID=UPI0021071126|nr:hypothetical protein [Arthrobacter zhaoxinii]MCQ2001031.1 hypothetical protein [Arthrobacter zhaoxinii]